MFHYLILLILSFVFGNLLADQNDQYPCFCNCCARKPCSLQIQQKILEVNNCNTCGQSCRTQFLACRSVNDTGKMFELCSTNVDIHNQKGKNDYDIVKSADILFDNFQNQTLLNLELDELRKVYEEKVKNGTTNDQMSNEKNVVRTAFTEIDNDRDGSEQKNNTEDIKISVDETSSGGIQKSEIRIESIHELDNGNSSADDIQLSSKSMSLISIATTTITFINTSIGTTSTVPITTLTTTNTTIGTTSTVPITTLTTTNTTISTTSTVPITTLTTTNTTISTTTTVPITTLTTTNTTIGTTSTVPVTTLTTTDTTIGTTSTVPTTTLTTTDTSIGTTSTVPITTLTTTNTTIGTTSTVPITTLTTTNTTIGTTSTVPITTLTTTDITIGTTSAVPITTSPDIIVTETQPQSKLSNNNAENNTKNTIYENNITQQNVSHVSQQTTQHEKTTIAYLSSAHVLAHTNHTATAQKTENSITSAITSDVMTTVSPSKVQNVSTTFPTKIHGISTAKVDNIPLQTNNFIAQNSNDDAAVFDTETSSSTTRTTSNHSAQSSVSKTERNTLHNHMSTTSSKHHTSILNNGSHIANNTQHSTSLPHTQKSLSTITTTQLNITTNNNGSNVSSIISFIFPMVILLILSSS